MSRGLGDVYKRQLKKLGEPKDIASLIYFLSSEDASWITGEVVTIDGGFLL